MHRLSDKVGKKRMHCALAIGLLARYSRTRVVHQGDESTTSQARLIFAVVSAPCLVEPSDISVVENHGQSALSVIT